MRATVVFVSCTLAWGKCGHGVPKDLAANQQVYQTLTVQDSDPRLGSYQREYMIRLPKNYDGNTKTPVFMYFHGWGSSMYQDDWKAVANQYGAIIVNPNGMGEGTGSRSFNCGQATRSDSCQNPTDRTVYKSCRQTNQVGPCNCFTCHDDVKFVADLASHLESELCIDTASYFAAGASNGGIFMYYLVPQLVERGLSLRFKAVAPWYGANFVNDMDDVPAEAAGTSFFHFHGLQDTVVPAKGGRSDDGYLYTPVGTTLHEYASINGCSSETEEISTPFSGGMSHTCLEHKKCNTKARVVRCNYPDQQHAFWPNNAEALTFYFFESLMSDNADNATTVV